MDGMMLPCTIEAARRHSNKVFFYLYAHRNNHSFNENFGNLTEDAGKRKFIIILRLVGEFKFQNISAYPHHWRKNYGRKKNTDLWHLMILCTGVCHGDELLSMLNLGSFPAVTEGPDLAVSLRFVNYWINFIKTGYVLKMAVQFLFWVSNFL